LLKNIAENNFFTGRINVMRASHKLPPIKNRETDFETLTKQDVPLIVPINAVAFGGRPPDWGPSLVMTDFVHLSPSIPAGTDGIDLLQPALKAFILQAKADGKPICAVAFSSMPVGRTAVLGLSTLVAEKSRHGARVIAIVGTRPKNEVTDVSMEKRAGKLAAAKRIIEIAGAPFGVLFPLCDFVVVHGGLGTTSEAFRAGKPLLVTGIMVFDQRFWGRRVSALGVGPNPVHIRRLPRVLVDIVDKALTPGNEWAQNAKVLQKIIAEGHHGDGVQFTVDALVDAVEHRAKVVNRSS
jgi:sterol 3beta-glucosyltransferase